jgi:putative ABC transport system permease protein
LAAIGIALGFAGALALTRLMTSLLFGVSPTEPLVYVGVATILVAVTLAAVAVPSSRAARVDPIVALRES